MKTLEEKIAELKTLNPKLYSGSEEDGYVELSEQEYETTIVKWAKNLPPEPKTEEEILTEEAAKATQRQALLDKLGITEDEAKLLLGGN